MGGTDQSALRQARCLLARPIPEWLLLCTANKRVHDDNAHQAAVKAFLGIA
jgi:hypothetical protein